MTALAETLPFLVVPPNMRQIRVRCGWTFNRTIYFDERNILFEVTKCCDHCRRCLAREAVVDRALARRGAQYTFTTDFATFTRWVTVARPDNRDPLDYLKEVTELPIERVFFEIRRAMRKRLDLIGTGLLALCILLGVGWFCWEIGTRLIAYLLH